MARSDVILVVINLAWNYVVPQKYLKWIDHFYGFCGKKRTDQFVFLFGFVLISPLVAINDRVVHCLKVGIFNHHLQLYW